MCQSLVRHIHSLYNRLYEKNRRPHDWVFLESKSAQKFIKKEINKILKNIKYTFSQR